MKTFFLKLYEEEKTRVEKVVNDWRTLFTARRGVATLLFCCAVILGFAFAVEMTLLGQGIDLLISAKSVRTMTSELSKFIPTQIVFIALVGASLRLRTTLSGLARSVVDSTIELLYFLSVFFLSLFISPVFVPIMAGVGIVTKRSGKLTGELLGAGVVLLLYIAFCYQLVDAGIYLERTLGEVVKMITLLTGLALALVQGRTSSTK